jgi:CyaY protein
MTDLEFMDQAEAVLHTIEQCCDRINEDTQADIDNQRVGGMVTLVFANGSQIVVNLQKPLHEIWLAARSGGYHFKFDGSQLVRHQGAGGVLRAACACLPMRLHRPVPRWTSLPDQFRNRSRILLRSSDGGNMRVFAALDPCPVPESSMPRLDTPSPWAYSL